MEALLQRAGSQAVTFVIRSSITMASGYAFKKLNQFSSQLPELDRKEIERTRRRLATKIQILTPALDLVELVAARGNTLLEGTLNLAQALKKDIEGFELDIETASEMTESDKSNASKSAKQVLESMRGLLERIEEAIPLIQLALSTAGVNVSPNLPNNISPSRLMQAAHFLTVADTQYKDKLVEWKKQSIRRRVGTTKAHQAPTSPRVKVGPDFFLTMYSIFSSTNRKDTDASDITWREEFAKCRISLYRVRVAKNSTNVVPEYQYVLQLVEDFNDDRYHEDGDVPQTRLINVSSVARLFFSASGSLLEIEEALAPVLVLKLNKMSQTSDTENRASADDAEWLAFALYQESEWRDESSSEYEVLEHSEPDTGAHSETDSELSATESLRSEESENTDIDKITADLSRLSIKKKDIEPSLSLLEYLIRLTALQANDQKSIYAIHDERIALYLRDESQQASTSRASNRKASPESVSRDEKYTPESSTSRGRNRKRSPESVSREETYTRGSNRKRSPEGPSRRKLNADEWQCVFIVFIIVCIATVVPSLIVHGR